MRILVLFLAVIFSISSSNENNFKLSLSKGLGFYTIGDYEGVEQTLSLSYFLSRNWGFEVYYNNFDYGQQNFYFYSCHAKNYGIHGIRKWSPFKILDLNFKAGVFYHNADLEESFATFWANGENIDWLEKAFHDFLTPQSGQIPLGPENYRFHAQLPDEYGISVVNITEIKKRQEFGYSASIDLALKYDKFSIIFSPSGKFLLDGLPLTWSMAGGFGLEF